MRAPARPSGLRRYAAPAAALLLGTTLGLSGCSGDGPGKPTAQEGSGSAEPSPTESSPTGPTSSDPSDPGGDPSSPSTLEGGTAERPAVPTAQERILDWQRVPGPVEDEVTRSGPWTLRVDQSGTSASLEGPDSASGIAPGPRQKVSDALVDGDWAVVVMQDEQETRPSSAQVRDLRTGKEFTIDGSSDVPTTNGGTWALGDGTLLHATIHRGAYCTATVDLATRKSTLGWCAPKRHGFNSARATPAGWSLLTFDDSRPVACRTVVRLDGGEVTPFEGVPDCKAWDGLVTDDGAVWSVIPRERAVESAEIHARSGDGWFDLGPATSGSLTWCGGAAYFVRDPQRDQDPARLMRWSADSGLETVYETTGGHAFLETPRCGGDTITVTARAQSGDEQVSAPTG